MAVTLPVITSRPWLCDPGFGDPWLCDSAQPTLRLSCGSGL